MLRAVLILCATIVVVCGVLIFLPHPTHAPLMHRGTGDVPVRGVAINVAEVGPAAFCRDDHVVRSEREGGDGPVVYWCEPRASEEATIEASNR